METKLNKMRRNAIKIIIRRRISIRMECMSFGNRIGCSDEWSRDECRIGLKEMNWKQSDMRTRNLFMDYVV